MFSEDLELANSPSSGIINKPCSAKHGKVKPFAFASGAGGNFLRAQVFDAARARRSSTPAIVEFLADRRARNCAQEHESL